MTEHINPHLTRDPVATGVPLAQARRVGIMVHGRDQDESVMLDVVARLALTDVGYLLPVAAQGSWYPGRYFDPVADNEPYVSWALEALEAAVTSVHRAGVDDGRIVLCGFSQGASLVAELAARRPRRFAGVAVLTGSLLGPAGARVQPHDLGAMPMFFASARQDPWIELGDAQATARAFELGGADVDFVVVDDREHRITDEAVAGVRALLTPGG